MPKAEDVVLSHIYNNDTISQRQLTGKMNLSAAARKVMSSYIDPRDQHLPPNQSD